ncbi:MAG: tRNA pseudouridine(13) synthase TruD, partial [Myxococcota bacterium]
DAERARAFEISATGPIIGTKMRMPRDEAAALEATVLSGFGFADGRDLKPPRGVRAQGTRRPLRVRPRELAVERLEYGRGLRVVCRLPPGAYVTVLLETIVGPVVDVALP